MNNQLLIVGGGIGGLASALACARAGVHVELLEQAPEFTEVGAGIQLGPNAVRVLADWGQMEALRAVAAFPERLTVRDAHDGGTLGTLPLGEQAQGKYGQPYATIHRADAHQLLLRAVQQLGQGVLPEHGDGQLGRVSLKLRVRIRSLEETAEHVSVFTEDGHVHEAPALLGCDGLWSVVRQHLVGYVLPRFSGHLAYRGLVDQTDLPAHLRTQNVTAWLGPSLHVVHYPVSGGKRVNVVAVVHGRQTGNPQSWSHEANQVELMNALGTVHPELQAMLDAVPNWKLWPLNDRPPMTGAYEHAQGRVALAGDAAHPMRPYLAQGAAMALEDAWTLGVLAQQAREAKPAADWDWPALWTQFANARWQRNAWVQARSARNGGIFHADGLLRVGRNLAMACLGEGLLDNPKLYSGPPRP